MKHRYMLIKPWEQLQGGTYAGIAQFALNKSESNGQPLVVCVHVKRDCDEFLKKAFGVAISKKLLRDRSISIVRVPAYLESTITLKKRYINKPEVYLLFFPSPELLQVAEKAVDGSTIVVFTEEANSEHVESWCQQFSPNELAIQE